VDLGEFIGLSGMSSQSHISHCRVLPLGEFTVTIPEPHATLQGVIIPSVILKIVFCHILFIFLFLMQFKLWWSAAFVSSPIHLFFYFYFFPKSLIQTAQVPWCKNIAESGNSRVLGYRGSYIEGVWKIGVLDQCVALSRKRYNMAVYSYNGRRIGTRMRSVKWW